MFMLRTHFGTTLEMYYSRECICNPHTISYKSDQFSNAKVNFICF